ncbi:MAG: glycosyltransferase family 4 protein [Planctomycetes bacterium]|nr:glycosyltransferase family 4 protein [Planctomycetota bacterium]
MRIFIVVDCYFPYKKSSAKLVHDLGVEFHRQGHEVIITAPDDALTTPSRVTVEQGLTVLRIRTYPIKGSERITRAINEIRLSSIIWKTGKNFFQLNQCDLIVLYAPSIFFASLIKKLKKLWNCKTYLIQRDIFPQWAIDTGEMKEGLISRFFRHKEKQHYAIADIIGVQSPENLQYFSEHGLADMYNLEVLYNWTTTNEKKIIRGNDRQKLGLQDKVVLFYGGNIGVAQDMDNIIHLAENMSNNSHAHFLLVGEGSEVPRLKAMIKKKQMSNITILPAVTQQEYLGMLSQFDIGLISLDRQLKTHNFPGKMLGYMYFSMPILACINPGNDLKQIIEESNAGLICLAGEHSVFCAYAERLVADVDLRREMGNNARAVLEKTFSVKQAVSQILSHKELYRSNYRNDT